MENLLQMNIFLVLFCLSFCICSLIVFVHPWLAGFQRSREDLDSVQCAHLRSTPRIGGVGVVIATMVGLLFLLPAHQTLSLPLFALTLMPVFLTGLAEDLGWRVSASGRLLAAAISALLAVALLRIWLPPLEIPVLDVVMTVAPLAIAVTILWATGVCHAFNLIDGVNGLAGGTALLIAIGIALVAQQAGATGHAAVAAALVPALLGFLLLNWPFGRIFLGDAGAYSIGHALVWLAISLAWVNAQVSALALALMFFWPVADTFLAMARRMRSGRPVGAPDRLHYHQFVMRALILLSDGRIGKSAANSATTVIMLPLVAIPVFTAVYLWDRPVAAVFAWGVFGVLFTLSYLAGMRFFRSRRAKRLAKGLGPLIPLLRRVAG